MMFTRDVVLLLVGALLFSAIGCGGGSGAPEYTEAGVTGTVSYKGTPIEKGKIRFIPDGEVVDGQAAGKAIFVDIVDGKYSVVPKEGAEKGTGVFVGKNRVEITSYRGTGKMLQTSAEDGKKEEEMIQFIPAKYNSKSTLSVEVKEGKNTHNFELKVVQ